MTPAAIAHLALWAASSRPVTLTIDPCVDADRDNVSRLVATEFPRPSAAGSLEVLQVIVTCSGELNQVRVIDPHTSTEIARNVDLRAAGAAGREAKSRELALAIGELVKSVSAETDKPPPSSDAVEPIPERAPETNVVTPLRRKRGEFGLLLTGAKYDGGYVPWGFDGAVRFAIVRGALLELRAGMRSSLTLTAPDGPISSHSVVGAIAAGIDFFPSEKRAGLALLARAEGDWITVQGNAAGNAAGRSASGPAFIVSAAPSGWVSIGSSLHLVAEPSLLIPVHTLAIHDQNTRVSTLSGVGAGATLGMLAEF